MPKIRIDATKAIQITDDHGGYHGAKCIACGAVGWLDTGLGYPYGSSQPSRLVHKRDCPMNAVINSDGSVKE